MLDGVSGSCWLLLQTALALLFSQEQGEQGEQRRARTRLCWARCFLSPKEIANGSVSSPESGSGGETLANPW